MNKVTRRLITSVCLLGASYASAQTTFYVEGLGRAQISNETLEGNAIETDTVGGTKVLEKVNTGGYTLLDLGFNIEKNEKFFLNTILRGRDEFGLFWGEGTTFEFRRITMGGIIGKGIKYELGDVYVDMTPYTVFYNDVDFTKYESDIFTQRREIVEYENFVSGNSRFLQGFKGSGNLLFASGIEKLELFGFTTRTSSIRETGEPDVLLSGVRANAIQGKYGSFGLNFAALYDLPVSTNTQVIRNVVLSGNINPKYDLNDDVTLGIESEIGSSNYKLEQTGIERQDFADFFLDAKFVADLKKLKASAKAGYLYVGSGFRSPGAQSRRINASSTAQIFSSSSVDTTGALVARDFSYYDRFTQENAYNGAVDYKLGYFNPAFDNINPYGKATPNRQGFTVNLERESKDNAFGLTLDVALLSEIDPDSTTDSQARDFMSINAGGIVNIGKILKIKRDISIKGGFQQDKTTRGGAESIDLTSSVIDLGISAELVDKLDLLLGYKSFDATGNEYVFNNGNGGYSSIYEANNVTRTFNENREFNISEQYISIGGRFRFTEKASLIVNYNLNSFNNDSKGDSDDFEINQLYINYTMKF